MGRFRQRWNEKKRAPGWLVLLAGFSAASLLHLRVCSLSRVVSGCVVYSSVLSLFRRIGGGENLAVEERINKLIDKGPDNSR